MFAHFVNKNKNSKWCFDFRQRNPKWMRKMKLHRIHFTFEFTSLDFFCKIIWIKIFVYKKIKYKNRNKNVNKQNDRREFENGVANFDRNCEGETHSRRSGTIEIDGDGVPKLRTTVSERRRCGETESQFLRQQRCGCKRWRVQKIGTQFADFGGQRAQLHSTRKPNETLLSRTRGQGERTADCQTLVGCEYKKSDSRFEKGQSEFGCWSTNTESSSDVESQCTECECHSKSQLTEFHSKSHWAKFWAQKKSLQTKNWQR